MSPVFRSLLLGTLVIGTVCAGEVRTPWTASRIQGTPNPPLPFQLKREWTSLNFTNPVDLAFSAPLARWFVAEQGGKIFSFDASGTDLIPAADLRSRQGADGALYALTFDPGFASNHWVYVCYVQKSGRPDGSRVSRFKVRPDATFDLATEEIIITWLSGGHNGCCLRFGTDGYLYISTGDGAGPNPPDPLRTGQDLSDLLSSILRIDVRHRDGEKNYSVPEDNPFRRLENARPEIWAYGLRNPWRMAIDQQTGDLWVADVGWELWELVYRVERGGNYGWSLFEGRQPVLPNERRGPTPVLPPLKDHPHSEAASITGGLVYYGQRFPELRGAFIYGDWETGKIWGLRADRDRVTWTRELADSTIRVVAFAPDSKGEIVILDYNGGIYSLEPHPAASESTAFPTRLSQTGLFRSTESLTPEAGVYPFEIGAPMWRDFARGQRLIALPGLSTVDPSERPWRFPSNAVLALTYSLEMEPGHPQSARRVETQILHFTGDGWGAYSYKWNAAQTDAELVPPSGENAVLRVKDPSQPNGIREQPWRFQSQAECLRCHNPWCGTALGFQPEQLGPSLPRDLLSGPIKNDVHYLSAAGDPNASLSERARSYLHANCSHCHRENAGGSVPAVMDIDLPLEKMRMVDALPIRGDLGLDHGKVIAPGEPFSSVLLFRASATGRSRMPYLSSELVDDSGIALLREWIASLGESKQPGLDPKPRSTTEALRLAHALPAMPVAQRVSLAREAIRSHPDNPLFRDLLDRFLPSAEQTTLIPVNASASEILALRGDPRRGAALLSDPARFSCLQCHRFNGQGKVFGPDLSAALRGKSRPQILESILEPSKEILPEFILHSAEFPGEEPISGILVKKSASESILRDAAGVDHPLSAAQIKTLRPQALSAMPEGLLANAPAQDIADLLAALAGPE